MGPDSAPSSAGQPCDTSVNDASVIHALVITLRNAPRRGVAH